MATPFLTDGPKSFNAIFRAQYTEGMEDLEEVNTKSYPPHSLQGNCCMLQWIIKNLIQRLQSVLYMLLFAFDYVDLLKKSVTSVLNLIMIAPIQLRCTFSYTNPESEPHAPNTYQSKLVPGGSINSNKCEGSTSRPCVVAVSCGYDTCFAVRACDGLCHLAKSMDHIET